MPQSKLVFFASHPLVDSYPLVAAHPHFLGATFFATHPLVASHPPFAKFLGVRGYFT
ncbi:MAG: hypothetical protein MR769_03175 [Campylobacter sp.]|uniref:hypothetical protein n=1 Tax=Campylobacter sp. TaxID=205 RepID=UPI002AA917BA|nr:hypothetical protein [Campylobacter sp.]MCI6343672.1 hypothetical protein [Campylobacter sp.]MCI7463821.1 hypothetical protein [Campylobacter sp.]